jgi:hypothetical protein
MIRIDALWLCTKPVGSGQASMVVRRQRTGWSACCGGDEPGVVRQVPWPRSVGLPQGRAHAAANTCEQPHNRLLQLPSRWDGETLTSKAYGEPVDAIALIPHMLAEFMAPDRGFQAARKKNHRQPTQRVLVINAAL